MGVFNTYNLNGNFTTDDGILLIAPTWKVSILDFRDDEGKFIVLLNWKNATNDIVRILDNEFATGTMPTVSSIESAIMTLPQFSNSTLVT